jgi:hypothetical protein
MPKSVRVSDDLYELADAASSSAHRSLAQQIEYWAALGRAIEAAGVTTAQAQHVIKGDRRARERVLLKLGLADPQSMYLFPCRAGTKNENPLSQIEGLASSDAGRTVAKRYKVHVADAIDPVPLLHIKSFRAKKLPQLLKLMSAGRQTQVADATG